MANNGKLIFEQQGLDGTKQTEVWNFLTQNVNPAEEIRVALSSKVPEHKVALVNYWHTSTDPQEHLTVAIMWDIYVETFTHVYRNGQVKRIDEGRGLFYTTEQDVHENGKIKKKKVWRFTDGGKPVTSETLKSEWQLAKSIFD